VSLVVLSKLFDWRNALVVVQPATLIRWHLINLISRDALESFYTERRLQLPEISDDGAQTCLCPAEELDLRRVAGLLGAVADRCTPQKRHPIRV
jgi:hypothetical protein